MEEALNQLIKMNQEVMTLQEKYCNKKEQLKELESTIYLYGEKECSEAIGKEKPSQKDKEHFANLKTLKLQSEVDKSYLEYKYSQENYKLHKMLFRAKYNTEAPL